MEIELKIEKVKFVVRAIIKNNLNQILILQRLDGSWCLPGGKINSDEQDPIEALHREIFEELKLKITTHQLFSTLEDSTNNLLWHNAYYIAQVEQYQNIQLEESESLQYKWVNAKSLKYYKFAYENNKVIESFFCECES